MSGIRRTVVCHQPSGGDLVDLCTSPCSDPSRSPGPDSVSCGSESRCFTSRGEVESARAGYFVRLAAEVELTLRTRDQVRAQGVITSERDDFLAALRCFTDSGHGEQAIELVHSLLW